MNFSKFLVSSALVCIFLTGCKSDPEYEKAKESFDLEVGRIESQIEKRDQEIAKAEELLALDKIALDKTVETSLKNSIDTAKNANIEIPDIPKETNEIKESTKKLEAMDLTGEINDLKNAEKLLEDSRKQYEALLNPSKEFLIDRLKKVDDIDKIEAVTEENDPNGQLNKAGGYTAQVYFSSPQVNDETGFFTGDVIEDGTEAGGSIEVYKTVTEANKRNDYLSAFDGQALSSGSHTVYGSIIIRTSSLLTASQQKEQEEKILNELIRL